MADRSRDLVETAYLDEFLFGAQRVNLTSVRDALADVQDGRCFYCDSPMTPGAVDVDHFIPWARHPDNGLDNLVAAHRQCNNAKRESLAAAGHLEHWLERLRPGSAEAGSLTAVAEATGWLADRDRTTSAVRASYLWLPDDAWLWRATGECEQADNRQLRGLLLGA